MKRYDVRAYLDPRDDDGHLIGKRVSEKRALELVAESEASRGDDYFPAVATESVPPRFKIKIARHETANRFKLRDAERPAFVGQYPTLDRAMLAIDNTIRREHGLPERLSITPDEIRAAMETRRANLLGGKVPHAAPVRPTAPHSGRCACTVEPILPAEYVEEGINR